MKININHIFSVYIATVCDQIRYTSVSLTPVGISEKGLVIACSPRWYMTWLFLSFPTFGYSIKYLTELKKTKSYTN